jgi:glutamate synthase domain-containing protein 2/glutamate synthase domain-containing protein 1/glutamate synthase domain-containing protein 3
VGFVAARGGESSHAYLRAGLDALACVEHRGALAGDGITGDGAGVMTEIPWRLIGKRPGVIAIATLFLSPEQKRRDKALEVFEQAFNFLDLRVEAYRDLPVRPEVLGPLARESLPVMRQAIISRPLACRTDASFDARLYQAKQITRSKLRRRDAWHDLYFTSLSTRTVVYKALSRAADLELFYPDLSDPAFETRFCLFHRRFSTNTRTSWDKAQPLRVLAHNGEINTIAGNRSWAYSREQALGLGRDELLTHQDISDSGNVNEMAEALRFRSSIPRLEEALAIMIPPADERNAYYDFWGRAMEPWDGPALISYSDGEVVGARLDRNGFRPARWMMTQEAFYLASEAGIFDVEISRVEAKGTLRAGSGVTVLLDNGKVHFRDPSRSRENQQAAFDARLVPLWTGDAHVAELSSRLGRGALHGLTKEELDKVLVPMAVAGKEAIGSMGDTSRLAVLSDERRSLYDFFSQDFAQVTNPPLDYLRERMVTDLSVVLGKRPNIFAPKELIPQTPGIRLDSPLLDLEQMAGLRQLKRRRPSSLRILAHELDCTFSRAAGSEELARRLEELARSAVDAVDQGHSLLILSDREASEQRPPVPSLLALRSVVNALNREGLRLEASIVVEAGDIRATHELACAVGFGATAVCPWLAFSLVEGLPHRRWDDVSASTRRSNLRKALEQGLLKIMAKMGISVVRSYQSSKLFSAVGLGPRVLRDYFPGLVSRVGGYEIEDLGHRCLLDTEGVAAEAFAPSRHLFMEHPRGTSGEKHSMFAKRAKLLHRLVRGEGDEQERGEQWSGYEKMGRDVAPINLRHLLRIRKGTRPIDKDSVETLRDITARFGSGAMSYGAISAEAQRDIFMAMQEVGGRSNSGEGGENPYYFVDGTRAYTKQVASGRFGVNAEYLLAAEEIEIKIAQGAKPGEGGQLMGLKVDAGIALARHASPGTDLISPPPLHDIYSIEDLKQLIYELRQLNPVARVCVKLVSGKHVGTVAVGVVKAGAQIIHISGYDGGTGAAPISSMRHAGLPWELGLGEVHRALVDNELREHVTLRVDGGLSTAEDIIMATALGAEEFAFGKLLLVAQGCIMARICEKNRCPTGIATHDPKFKAKYKGRPSEIVETLDRLGEGIRSYLAELGRTRLSDLVGDTSILEIDPAHRERVASRRISLGELLHGRRRGASSVRELFEEGVNPLNARIVGEVLDGQGGSGNYNYPIRSTDRAVPARLCGRLAEASRDARMGALTGDPDRPNRNSYYPASGTYRLNFEGSAGQGFGAFLVDGVELIIEGEANDSVGKSMAGGRIVLRAPQRARFDAGAQVILGNCALYGATGGELYAHGRGGDRFAVRNSGARCVVEGVGLHACEYMTGGSVLILGSFGANAGAGMTGGELFALRSESANIDTSYVCPVPLDDESRGRLRELLLAYVEHTGANSGRELLAGGDEALAAYERFVPLAARPRADSGVTRASA